MTTTKTAFLDVQNTASASTFILCLTVRMITAFMIAVTNSGVFFSQGVCAAPSQRIRPNVLLIMTDDQGWGDLSIHGNEKLSTPHLDGLARESVRLSRFFVSPVCAPTRAALLTGRFPERTGVFGVTGRREVMRADEFTLAEMLSEAGYRTGCFGKWHNGAQMPNHPLGQGFDTFFGFCGGHWNLYHDTSLQHDGQPAKTSGFIIDAITDEVITYLKHSQNDSRPFFCYVPLNTPHSPNQVDRKLFDKYNDGSIDEKTAAVYAMVDNIDSNVHRMLRTLREEELEENTIVIFLTDNGPNGKRFNGGMRGSKASIHEGGSRVPCFIRWPGKLGPKEVPQIAAHIDLLPTLAEFTGAEIPDGLELDGRSIAKLLRTGADPELSDRVFFTLRSQRNEKTFPSRAAARSQRFRLTIEKGKRQLFDMQTDPGQKTDVSNSFPEETERLKRQLDQYIGEVRDQETVQRPVPVGFGEFVSTYIPAVEMQGSDGIRFANRNGYAHDWIEGWDSSEQEVSVPLQFAIPGDYEIRVHLHSQTAGTSIVAICTDGNQESSTRTTLPKSTGEHIIRPDLDSNSEPRGMMEFPVTPIGTISVSDAGTPLTLTLQAKSSEAIDLLLGGVSLRRTDLPERDSFHLFVLAGQSNMAGRGKVLPVDRQPTDGVKMLGRSGRWVDAIAPVHYDKSVAGVGIARSFAQAYRKAHPGVTVGLIPCAVGGSPIAAWQPGGFHRQTKTHPYDDAISRIRIARRAGIVKGILWHQGESDCKPDLVPPYENHLLRTFANLREVAGGQEIPILLGGLGRFDGRPWNEQKQRIDAIHRQVGNTLNHAGFVDATGLRSKSDLVHFDRKSLIEFGRRYAESYLKLTRHPSVK